MTTVRKQAKDFAMAGYIVRPAENGGFVAELGDFTGDRYLQRQFATFTNSSDLMAFLSKGHAEFDKEFANG